MADLFFAFQEMADEIDTMSRIAAEFLSPGTLAYVIPNLLTSLDNIRATRRQVPQSWTIDPGHPIQTVESAGEYENGDRRGVSTIVGRLTFVWHISCPQEQHRRRPQSHFVLSGLSSTKIQLFESHDGNLSELATWRFEVGDQNSPGCHFHTQIEGERNDPPYPRRLSVPRFPAILITPMAALEFLLGEIFQTRWRRQALRETPQIQRWREIQRNRLVNLFDWQMQFVRQCAGSPWTALKAQKPEERLFIRR
jgi:hypothetical protein